MFKRLIALGSAACIAAGALAALSPLSASASVYDQPGDHNVNGRYWKTACEMYSTSVVRCTTKIWATTVVEYQGRYYNHQGWVFNNLSYLPSARQMWATNPLGNNTKWTAADGRQWRTECDTPATGRGACRSYAWSTLVTSANGQFVKKSDWVFNNVVLFATGSTPAVTSIPAAAPAVPNMPVEKPFTPPSSKPPVAPIVSRPKPPATTPPTTTPPSSCRIKGNISSSGERIYHVPGQRHYDITVINTADGERWFCTEAEARSAGWRRSLV